MTHADKLFQLDITVSGMLWLDLLDQDSPFVRDNLATFLGDLTDCEFAALFHIRWPEDESSRYAALLATRRGWIIRARIALPLNVRRSRDGAAVQYSVHEAAVQSVFVYGETLGTTLDSLIEEAGKIRVTGFPGQVKE